MKLEDIKVGETYLLPITVTAIEKSGWIETTTCNNNEYFHTPSEVKTLLPNGTKNTEPAPKYDPCRLFKKGDKVRVVEYKGRNYTNVDTGKEGVVTRNETGADPAIEVAFADDDFWDVDPAYLELVTPVEEQKEFFIEDEKELPYYLIHFGRPRNFELVAQLDRKYYTLEQANAECDRLNAEYRKERENG